MRKNFNELVFLKIGLIYTVQLVQLCYAVE